MNPAILVKNWNTNGAKILVNGKETKTSKVGIEPSTRWRRPGSLYPYQGGVLGQSDDFALMSGMNIEPGDGRNLHTNDESGVNMKPIAKRNIRKALLAAVLCLPSGHLVSFQDQASGNRAIRQSHVGGYMITKLEKADESYNAGYSMYAAAWPLVREYPGRDFQSGLFGTWMHPTV